MTNLADKIEALEGPSREVDAEIYCAINGYEFVRWLPNLDRGVGYRKDDGLYYEKRPLGLATYTSSLDAAMTLEEGNAADAIAEALERIAKARVGKNWVERFPQFLTAAFIRAREANR